MAEKVLLTVLTCLGTLIVTILGIWIKNYFNSLKKNENESGKYQIKEMCDEKMKTQEKALTRLENHFDIFTSDIKAEFKIMHTRQEDMRLLLEKRLTIGVKNDTDRYFYI